MQDNRTRRNVYTVKNILRISFESIWYRSLFEGYIIRRREFPVLKWRLTVNKSTKIVNFSQVLDANDNPLIEEKRSSMCSYRHFIRWYLQCILSKTENCELILGDNMNQQIYDNSPYLCFDVILVLNHYF